MWKVRRRTHRCAHKRAREQCARLRGNGTWTGASSESVLLGLPSVLCPPVHLRLFSKCVNYACVFRLISLGTLARAGVGENRVCLCLARARRSASARPAVPCANIEMRLARFKSAVIFARYRTGCRSCAHERSARAARRK